MSLSSANFARIEQTGGLDMSPKELSSSKVKCPGYFCDGREFAVVRLVATSDVLGGSYNTTPLMVAVPLLVICLMGHVSKVSKTTN